MNHFHAHKRANMDHILCTQCDREALLCDIIGAWISNQEERHMSKSALKAANGSRTLIECNYKTRLKLKRDPKSLK
jgi:hypothetical protein